MSGGHPDVQKTTHKEVQNYYWLSLKKDVEEWVASWERCQRHDIIKTQGPWQVLGFDLIGPLPETSKGSTEILNMTCLFSKWVVARPLRGKKDPGVALMVAKTLGTRRSQKDSNQSR